MRYMEDINIFIEKLSNLFDKEQYTRARKLYEERAPHYLQSDISRHAQIDILLRGAQLYYFNHMYDELQSCLRGAALQHECIESNIDYVTLKFHSLSIQGKTVDAFEFIE